MALSTQGHVYLRVSWEDGGAVAAPTRTAPVTTLGSTTYSAPAYAPVHAASAAPLAGGGAFVRDDELRIDVGALELSSRLRNDSDVGEVWVAVDIRDVASASDMTTQRRRKSDSRRERCARAALAADDASSLRHECRGGCGVPRSAAECGGVRRSTEGLRSAAECG